MDKRMKRKLSIAEGLKGKLSSATPGSEPPSAETAKILPPAKPPKASQKASEMGNRDATRGWSDPVTSSAGRLKDQASLLAVMSEKQLDQLAPGLTKAERGILSHPIKLPPGLLNQTAMQLKTLERYKGLIEDLYPRAYQQLCKEQKFLGGTEPRELAFIDAHGRRWKAGEGFLSSAEGLEKAPEIDKLVFDPANVEASCKMLRVLFPRARLAKWNKTLAGHVEECHKAIHRAREARKELLRSSSGAGLESQPALEVQSYSAFAHGELVFIGSQIPFLWDYLDLRGKRVRPATAERRVLVKRRAEEKS